MLSSIPALTSCLGIAILLRPVLGHCKIVDVAARLDEPGPRSHGFIVNLHGKYPWHMGQPGDAGADAAFFSPSGVYIANPKFHCGQLATLPKGIDIKSSLAQAEASGVATTAPDGSFETLIFQVNRDGAGECICEYDTSATAQSWQQCKTLVNPPGIQGMWEANRVNHTAKFQLPSSTVCKGGVFRDKCIVRLRCGFKLRFGGCFAIKTPMSPPPLQFKVVNGGSSAGNGVSSMAAEIYRTMSAKGAIVPVAQAKKVQSRNAASSSSVDAVALQVIGMIQRSDMKVLKQKAQLVAHSYL